MRRYIDSITRDTVAVHTVGGMSLRGVLTAVHGDCIVVKHAALLQSDGATVPLDGEQVIPRATVAWLQRLSEVDT